MCTYPIQENIGYLRNSCDSGDNDLEGILAAWATEKYIAQSAVTKLQKKSETPSSITPSQRKGS